MKVPLADWVCSDKERRYINSVLDSGWVTYGPYCKKLEQVWSEYHSCRHGVVNSSGTAALQLAFRALKEVHNWDSDTEVIVPAITFPATINMIIESGLKPVLCDVLEVDGMVDVVDMEKRITPKTKAVCIVHLWGTPYPRKKELIALCHKKGLKIVEDSCETIDKSVGNWGEVSCFSMYFNHIISAGVGGMCCTNDARLESIMRSLANHGMRDTKVVPKFNRFNFDRVGYSMRITEFEAALGVAQWEDIESTLAHRRKINATLTEELTKVGIQNVARLIGGTMMYPILFSQVSGASLNDCMNFMDNEGIETRTAMPITNQPVYKGVGKLVEYYENYPIARNFNNRGMFFPINPMMTEKHCQYIATAFKKWLCVSGYDPGEYNRRCKCE
jgi:dTDP-4-amino-4,6-dideoxygalactose transaminase